MAKLNLNPTEFQNLEPMGDNSILPAGEYVMQIVQSDIRETKAGTGHYLWLEFDIIKGNVPAGRKFWDRLNILNPNETTRKIANQQLLSISRAVGMDLPPDDSERLHFKPIKVVIRHKENKQGTLEARPAYLSVSDSTPTAAPAPAAAKPAAAKPWEKHTK